MSTQHSALMEVCVLISLKKCSICSEVMLFSLLTSCTRAPVCAGRDLGPRLALMSRLSRRVVTSSANPSAIAREVSQVQGLGARLQA